jgi:hypothetical protein
MAQPFGHDIPRLSWIGAKTFAQHGISRKNHPGHSTEHAAANQTNLLMAADALSPAQPLLTEGTK